MVPAQLPYQLLYSLGSLNGAGGYYETTWQMYARLDVHGADIERRGETAAHRDGLAAERKAGVHRCVNGLEAGVVYGLVAVSGAALGLVLDTRPLHGAQAAFVVLGNLAISMAWFGLPHQWPEALWRHEPERGPWWPLRALSECPSPSY